ncbi:unnamed protein product [Sphacelaria rigidula]
MQAFYDSEVDDGPVTGYGQNAVQVLWKDSTELGCAFASCSDDGEETDILVCNYNSPSIFGGLYEDQLELPSESAEECGYV